MKARIKIDSLDRAIKEELFNLHACKSIWRGLVEDRRTPSFGIRGGRSRMPSGNSCVREGSISP
jgi:hypothetical protein